MFKSALTENSFLTCLNLEEKETIKNECVKVKLAKNQMLFSENGIPFGCYILKKGKVKLYKTGVLGKKQIFQICKSGDLLGF
ncbi:MAG: cyclic nucleotide-binding domain-containing protein, partial [Salibacteraceae bacterium]